MIDERRMYRRAGTPEMRKKLQFQFVCDRCGWESFLYDHRGTAELIEKEHLCRTVKSRKKLLARARSRR